MTIFLIVLINSFSAFVQAASGLGYAIFAMFFMPMLIPFQQCSVISAAVIVVIGVQMAVSLHSHLKIRKIVLPMTFCLMTTWLGIYIIKVTDEDNMRIIMGIFLILLAVYFYLTNKHNIRMKAGLAADIVIGSVTGLSTGMFNIVGPFLSLYYYDNCEDNLEFKANLEVSFLIAGVYSLCLNLMYVKPDAFIIKAVGLSAAGAVLAGIAGLHVFRKIDKDKLKYVIIGVLPVMGLILIFR